MPMHSKEGRGGEELHVCGGSQARLLSPTYHLAQVAAWSNHHQPERRVDFWTNPEAELDLAADAGVKVLRLGVDWGRVIPWVSADLSANRLPGVRRCFGRSRTSTGCRS
jgi:hypothetical protein